MKHYFAIALFRITPPCNEITALASKAIDTRSLSTQERLQLWVHLLICSACRRFNVQIHTLHELFHTDVHQGVNQEPDTDALADAIAQTSPKILRPEARNRIEIAITSAVTDIRQ